MKVDWIYRHWFIPAAIIIWIVDIAIVHISDWTRPVTIELILLISQCIILPLLYLCCYRSGLRRALIRAAALAFLGVWGVSLLVPDIHQNILVQLIPLRYIGIGVLFLIEIRLLIMMLSFITSHDENDNLSQELKENGDIPQWYANLMAYEAAFWRRLYQWLKRML